MKKENKLARAFAAADEELFSNAGNDALENSADFDRKTAAPVRKKNGISWRFVNTTGKKVAAAALALLIVAAAVFAIPAVRGQFGKNSVTEDENIIYRSENGDVTVRVVEPREVPEIYHFEWEALSDEMLNSAAYVFTGTVTDDKELAFDLGLKHPWDGTPLYEYRSLLDVKVDENIKGGLPIGGTVSVLFELSSHRTNEEEIYAEKGKQYVFFLIKTEDLDNSIVDFNEIADYDYCIPAIHLIPIESEQLFEFLEIIGAEEGTCGKDFVEALRRYYE